MSHSLDGLDRRGFAHATSVRAWSSGSCSGPARFSCRWRSTGHTERAAERLTDRPGLGDEPEAFKREVQAFVLSSSDVYSSTVAFEPFAFRKDRKDFSPYYYSDAHGKLAEADLADSEHDYRSRDWYREPVSTGQASWSGPYVDGGGGDVAVATYSVPFYSGNQPIGVVTADLALEHLEAIVAAVEERPLGQATDSR